MNGTIITPLLVVFGLLLTPLSVAGAPELPPPGGLPLSAILKSVEEQKLGLITEAEFDDGLWEVKVCDTGVCQKLYIDPRSGEEKRRRKTESDETPPADAMPLSLIVHSLEGRGLGIIQEVEFDDGYWEVELRRDGRKIKLAVDPRTAETRR